MNAPRLRSLVEILPAGPEPIAAETRPMAETLGAIAAEDVALPGGWPLTAVAREPGYAVRSRALIGATAYEPALFSPAPPLLAAGDPLPEGVDAILPPQATASSPLGIEAFAPLRPGEGVRRAGQDWPAGQPVLRAGAQIEAIDQAVLMTTQISGMRVRRVTISIGATLPPAIQTLLTQWSNGLGLRPSTPANAHIRLEAGAFADPQPALRPGRFGALQRDGEAWVLQVPPDIAEAVGLWHGLALPILAGLSGTRLRVFEGRLAGKLVSGIGFSELAFLRRAGDGWLPLETGECTLATLAQTEAVALVAAGSEGQPAEATIALSPLGGAFVTMRHGSSGP